MQVACGIFIWNQPRPIKIHHPRPDCWSCYIVAVGSQGFMNVDNSLTTLLVESTSLEDRIIIGHLCCVHALEAAVEEGLLADDSLVRIVLTEDL